MFQQNRLSRLKFDRFCVLHRPALAATAKVFSGVVLAFLGGIAGYSVARIESTQLLQAQAARHVQEILRVRDTYGAKAQETRESVKAAAEATMQAAEATKEIAKELGPETNRAARRAAVSAKRAEEAAQDAAAASQRVEEILPVPPVKVAPKDVPKWLDGP